MWNRVLAVFAVVIALTAASGGAEARRGGLPIPCMSSKLVKVMDLQDLTDARGTRVDLGYMYTGCFSGEWIGYIGSSSQYLTFKDGTLPEMMAAHGGGKPVPDEPSLFWGMTTHPGQFWVEVGFVVLGIGFALFAGFKKLLLSAVGQGATQNETPREATPRQTDPSSRQAAAPRAGFGKAMAARPAATAFFVSKKTAPMAPQLRREPRTLAPNRMAMALGQKTA
jgi:hypothetical protein